MTCANVHGIKEWEQGGKRSDIGGPRLVHAYPIHRKSENSGEGSGGLADMRGVDRERTLYEIEVKQLQPFEDAKRAEKLDEAADCELGMPVGGQSVRGTKCMCTARESKCLDRIVELSLELERSSESWVAFGVTSQRRLKAELGGICWEPKQCVVGFEDHAVGLRLAWRGKAQRAELLPPAERYRWM